MSRRSENTTKVFVGSLPPNVTAEDLRRLFAPYGVIAECDIANRCGFLHLEDKDLAVKAIEELNNTTFMGGRISVEKGRVKPPGRRGRGLGPMRGGDRDRGGPYARDRPRNGGYERDYMGYGGDRFEYGKPMPPPRNYDGYDRRPMYDDRRQFGNERRPYNNGYERRPPAYSEVEPNYDAHGGYDDRRVPPGSVGYDDRRPPVSDRRSVPETEPPAMGGPPRPLMTNYDRAANTDMYSRRDQGPPKPLMAGGNNMYDRQAPQTYTAPPVANTYPTGPMQPATPGAYGAPVAAGNYGTPAYGNTGAYGDNRGYAERPPVPPATAGYTDARTPAGTGVYPDNRAAAGYGTAAQAYDNTGACGDTYGTGRGNYDTSYPPLPQRGGFSSGGGGGSGDEGPRRDNPPSRRY